MEGPRFNSLAFIDHQIREIQSVLQNEKAIIACSGGVDSTTCAVLANRAVGRNLRCVFIDTNFMRLGEPEQVFEALSQPPLNLPVTVIDARERFMEALKGLTDAEAKRKAFRSTFYAVLSEVAREEGCRFLIQGTILPDVLETVGGIKTQHNVLEQMKIDTREAYGFKVVEPLVSLYKYHVREVAKKLGVAVERTERPPFPGPGLSVRVLGDLAGLINVAGAEITVRALKSRATGIKKGQRLYGRIVLIDIVDGEGRCLSQAMEGFDAVQRGVSERDAEASRVLYRLTDNPRRERWLIAVRAVETQDFVTARVSRIPWNILREVERTIRAACPTVSAVYYDITPKPPSSIEFE